MSSYNLQDSLSVKRVNYSFQMKVHLYYNEFSKNRSTDSTPMFFAKPVQLLHVEKVGFTSKSKEKGYFKFGNKFWKYKHATELSNEKAEELFGEIKNSYPYGFKSGDSSSILKYRYDVTENLSLQSFYKKYWFNHLGLVKNPVNYEGGTKDYPYPYIEYIINEIVTIKFPKGTVPEISSSNASYREYSSSLKYYETPDNIDCFSHDINVYAENVFARYNSLGEPVLELNYFIKEIPKYPLMLSSTGAYNFHLKSGSNGYGYWPTGSNGVFSGYKFSLSTGRDGSHNGYNEYTANVERFLSPEVHSPWYLSVGLKHQNHPHYENGSTSGYCISGTCNSPELTMVKGDSYSFNQTGASNSGHPLFIYTKESGGSENIYSSGIFHNSAWDTTGHGNLLFNVPYDSPNILYYQCGYHQYMGGKINLVNPTLAEGNVPGHTIRVKFTGTEGTQDKDMFYYSSSNSGMGNIVTLRKDC